nr:two-component response regulator [Ipomoea batatas]
MMVSVMSSDGRVDAVKKIVIQGACGYLLKPVRKEEIKLLWQHVVRHKQFVPPIGLDAVPKKILDLINVPHLTRENVASHLQVHLYIL